MKHKRTKATDIPKKVKEQVSTRDNGKCIICGQLGMPNAHYIKRSQGGLGIEQNIVTLCHRCHYEQNLIKRQNQKMLLYKQKIKK